MKKLSALQFAGLILFALVVLSATNAFSQTQYYVSTAGNDRNSGEFNSPFKSIEQAIGQAKNKRGNVVVNIRKGFYYLDTTLSLHAVDFLPSSLYIKAYQDEKVIISGARKLDLRWQPYKGKIVKARVPTGVFFERMFVNGQSQILARYPNYDPAARVFHGTASDVLSPERIKSWRSPAGGYVHALHAAEWGGFHYRITGKDARGNLLMEGGWQNNRPSAMHKEYRFVENIFEELDAPSEWFFNLSDNMLYFYPPEKMDVKTATIEVARLTESFALRGTMQKPLKNIVLSGLRFTGNERTFMKTREPLLRSDWTIYRGGALLLDGTENCRISDCIFDDLGGNAIMFSRYNRNDTISGNHIHHTGASAVAFIGDTKAVRSASFGYENFVPYKKLDKIPGPANNNFPQQCLVDNNLLHNLGMIEKQATGVEIEVASEITVSRNSIYNTPRAGINIGDGCFGGHIIEYNDVFDTVLETGDHGSFNSWGRDRYWSSDRSYMDSLVALHPELILLDARKTTVIRNNRWRCDHGWDVDLDDGSSNYHIYNNLFLNGGLKFREGFYRTAENNIMVNNTFHPHVWFKNSGDIFRRNIVMRKYAPIQISYWGSVVDDNLFPDDEALQLARKNGTDRNSLSGDPMFMNPESGDFRVKPNSPALKTGFRNFPMDRFGVQKPSLKRLAQKPTMPIPAILTTSPADDHPAAFLGGVIKSVKGLGERSAYGLPDENGVAVIEVGEGPLAKSGFRQKDVIRSVNDKPVKNAQVLFAAFKNLKNEKGTVWMGIIRGQKTIKIKLCAK